MKTDLLNLKGNQMEDTVSIENVHNVYKTFCSACFIIHLLVLSIPTKGNTFHLN